VVLYPDSRRGWEFLWILFRQRNQTEELDALMQNPDATRFLPAEYREDYYFEHAQWENYAAAIIETRVLNVGMLTLVSAFLVSFVWLVFLRSMDIFNRENWWNIALIFIAGAGFTHSCLPVYDYARLVLDFRINGEWWNDLLYCIAVIGGGEELVKMIPWVLFALFSRRFREPYDYLLYASVSALGFAFMENLMYLEESGNIVARSIMSAVGHMFNASVVAYAVILAKYRFRILFWRIAAPVIGFVLAAVCHGFYDFWLLSPSAEGYYFVTFLFFLFSLHIWFFFKNNAMNNSGFFTSGSFNAGFQQDLLTFSILSILILEFVMISLQFGTREGNQVIGARALIIGFFLIYMSVIIHKIELKQGVWRKWRFSIPRLSSAVFRLPYGRRGFYNHEDDDCEHYEESTDLTGLHLRLFAPKSNKYIGDKLPKSGMLVRKVTVSNDPDWYVLQLNSPIHYNNYVPTHIIVKNKHRDELLDQPKIEIYFMFIPDIELLRDDSIDVRQLRYAGRAYSMPLKN
jgi:RsiW-degrading membrane proteinase PrsW (M82 family)